MALIFIRTKGHKGVEGLVEGGEAESEDGGWSRLYQGTPTFRGLFLRALGCSLQLDTPGHTRNTLSKGTLNIVLVGIRLSHSTGSWKT